MRHGLWRAAAAVVVGMTLVVGAAGAQEFVGPPPDEALAPVPAPRALPDGKWFPYAPIELGATLPPPPRQPIEKWLRKCNIHCWSCLNCPGCGNCKTECTFIFGSCHAFYGQPCQPPPGSAWPSCGRCPPGNGCNCP
jgi:hypothetical protein